MWCMAEDEFCSSSVRRRNGMDEDRDGPVCEG